MTQSYSTVNASDSLSTGRGTWNDSLDTLRDNFSGTSAPTSPVVGQFYVDTTGAAERLEIRNADDDGWIILGDLDTGIHIPYIASYQFTLASASYSTEVIAPLAIMPYNATLIEAKLVSTQTTSGSGVSKKWVSSIRNTTEGVDISSADFSQYGPRFWRCHRRHNSKHWKSHFPPTLHLDMANSNSPTLSHNLTARILNWATAAMIALALWIARDALDMIKVLDQRVDNHEVRITVLEQ